MTQSTDIGDKLNGFYRGIVLKHLANGFCKIWVPSVYPEEWNSYGKADLIPSAEQASPISFGTNGGLGVFSYPNIGSVVWVFFLNGDQNLPVYFASCLGGPGAVSPNNWDSVRPMPSSHPEDAYIHRIHVKNSDVMIYETGHVTVHTENGDNNCDVVLDEDGNIKIDSTMQVSIHSKNVSIEADTQINIKTPTIVVDATNQANLTTPSFISKNKDQFSVKTPNFNIDSSEGGAVIKTYSSTTEF